MSTITSAHDFLVSIGKKTMWHYTASMTPNMSGRTIHCKTWAYTQEKLTLEELEHIKSFLVSDKLFIYPKEDMMGFVGGYSIYDINMLTKETTFLCSIGRENLPKEVTLKELFPLCHSDLNKQLMGLLPDWQSIKKRFEDYDY